MTPALLHTGAVMHTRHTPFRHHFSYRLWMVSADIDALGAVPARLFGHNRASLAGIADRDHGPRDGSPLRPWAEAQLREAGLDAYAHSIRFMAIPRVLGLSFNPISFYFCHDEAGTLGAVIHQVKNTFGDQTAYTLPVGNTERIHQSTRKAMHVSPFFDMQGGYRFAFSRPDFANPEGRFTFAILYGTEHTPRMTAVMKLRAEPMTNRALLRLAAEMPLIPAKVLAAIHWEALRLWVRGAKYHPVPARGTA